MARDERTPDRRTLPISSRRRRELVQQAALERRWLRGTEDRRIIEELRIDRTVRVIRSALNRLPVQKTLQAVDLGCGDGAILCRLPEHLNITATDAATNALQRIQARNLSNVRTQVEPLPITSLPDKAFDLVLCTHVLAELPPEDYRLLISELSRLVTDSGLIILSSDLDVTTDAAAERLENLVNTELSILERHNSYHGILLRFAKVLPFLHYQRKAVLLLEQIGRSCNSRRNLSHTILTAKKRPLRGP